MKDTTRAAAGGTHQALAPLLVLDRLEVGPVRIEPRRLFCPYTVVQDGSSQTFDLEYSYEEDVFIPGDPAGENLAAMIGAQVALNYGLFAREIVFRGPFDRHDRRLLEAMAANTAREIFVVKLLQPNPFLQEEAAHLPAVRLDTYLQAVLRFPDPPVPVREPAPWGGSDPRVAVLSSGGKDSLLTYGLLSETEVEAHSLFVNESGKHWFTALNAHRALAARDPRTARVWTNSDRLFNWMLRRLPFVRQDFQRRRSDEYPIRLWTVAVFLFGVLPLLRKRGIGRLAIGDEFDTSVNGVHEGIPHYAGLYDQSIYFDAALSRYFARKGWGVAQFSVLRPMSEFLIQKTLARRYPDLLGLQVSCHAAHMDGDRVRPCGDCEKCRRIVGMLTAIGVDPGALGYSEPKIEACLAALHTRGIHQETAGARHLAFLLTGKGVLDRGARGLPAPREQPEVEKLRFHSRRSPLNGIPRDLRRPLYGLLLQEAEGTVVRKEGSWVDVDLWQTPELDAPYGFGPDPAAGEAPAEGGDGARGAPGGKGTGSRAPGSPAGGRFLLAEMTWPQAEAVFRAVDVALLPVGSIEQHGHHLPLDTDAFDADYLCRRVAEACRDPKPIVLPLIPYGVSYHHDGFAGTVSISPDTLARLVQEVGMSVARQGIKKLVIVNGHGGNSPALHFAAQLVNRDAHIFTCVDTGETSDADIESMSETPNDVHAGEIETSTTLAVRPDLVDLKKARRFVPRFSNRYLDFSSRRSVGWYVRTEKISRTGVMGDPTKASAEKGRKMWDVMVKNLVELIEDIKDLSLEEIYQRRY